MGDDREGKQTGRPGGDPLAALELGYRTSTVLVRARAWVISARQELCGTELEYGTVQAGMIPAFCTSQPPSEITR